MSLQASFAAAVWKRGQEYYLANRVRNFRVSGPHYSADVEGSRTYQAELTVADGQIYQAACTCPAAAGGQPCKHMAALAARIMYYETRERRVAPRQVPLFSDGLAAEADDRSGYYDLEKSCAAVMLDSGSLELARAYAADGRVSLTELKHRFDPADEPILHVTGRYQEGRLGGSVMAQIRRQSLYHAECSLPSCFAANAGYYSVHSCCPHVAALLLLARDRLRQRPIGYGTDHLGSALLSAYAVSAQTAAARDREPSVRLEPRLVTTWDGRMYVDLRCGTDKLYVVKNAAALFEAEQQRSLYEAGSLKLDFSLLAFTPDCEALARWANRAMAVQREIIQHVVEGSNVSMRRSDMSRIMLAGRQLDEFFDWGLGRTLALNGGDTRSVTLEEGRPEIRFTVSPNEDKEGFAGVRVEGQTPAMQFTERYAYYLAHGAYLRADAEKLAPIRRLLEASGPMGGVSFTVGRDDLAAFYRQVLPRLRQCVAVEERQPERIARYVPLKPVFAFYLDYRDQTVLMEAKALYGDRAFPLYDGGMAGRDHAEESRTAEAVAPLFTQYDPDRGEYVLEADEDALYGFLTDGLDLLGSLGEIHATDRFSALKVRRRWSVTAGVRLESGVLDLQLLSGDLNQDELAALLNAYAARKRYHRLKSGEFVALERETAEQLDALFEAAHVPVREFVTGHMHLPQYRALYLDRVLEEHESIVSNRDRRYRELVKTFKTLSDSDCEPPESLAAVLRPYQRAGCQWLMTLYERGFGGILADDMGLGKTLQMIALFEHLRLTRPGATQLVVCPASLVFNWLDEIRRFAPELKAAAVAGSRDARLETLRQGGNWDVLVTSYDLFKRDVADYAPLGIHVAVLDEAQFIKNPSSAAARSVKALRCAHRFAMTGTPVENRLSELWSIFDFLMPGFLYGYEAFRRELENPIVRHGDEAARERLRRMTAPFILRRLKKDVLRDLPDKNEEQRRVALEGKQRQLYDAQVLRLRRLLDRTSDEDFRHSKLQVLAELTRLRQLCCDPSLLYGDYDGGSAKLDALLQLLTTAAAGGHKVLVFSQFTSMLEIIKAGLRREGLTWMLLTGETDKQERVRLAGAFNEDDTNVFLISLRAGGTGLNLTGADIVVHYDPWWNFAVEQQATDRAHRIGQTRAVTVYKLIAKDTVEERIVALQDSKRDLAEGILSGDSVSLKDMSREELLDLLS